MPPRKTAAAAAKPKHAPRRSVAKGKSGAKVKGATKSASKPAASAKAQKAVSKKLVKGKVMVGNRARLDAQGAFGTTNIFTRLFRQL